MPRFEPFAGVRYDPGRVDIADVVAPPYDVIDAGERARLEARSPYNAVRVELGRDEPDRDRYTAARARLDRWMAAGVLVTDPGPGFYAYRMGWRDEAGLARQTAGVLGALELSPPDEGHVLPHERTMGKPKDDRLRLLRACRANLSPVWCLSLATGLTSLCELPGPPLARCTDPDGVHHRLWRITAPGLVAAVAAAVGSAPVVIADGHHRYETALAYRDERRATTGGALDDADLLLAFVVELGEDQVGVRPIHRLLTGLPDGLDLVAALSPSFDTTAMAPFRPQSPANAAATVMETRMADTGALGLLHEGRSWLLRPRSRQPDMPDSAMLGAALARLPAHHVDFEPSAAAVVERVSSGRAQAGVLLRPVTVGQIADAARAGHRMPEKTTFFHPKPRTGMVFRRLAG